MTQSEIFKFNQLVIGYLNDNLTYILKNMADATEISPEIFADYALGHYQNSTEEECDEKLAQFKEVAKYAAFNGFYPYAGLNVFPEADEYSFLVSSVPDEEGLLYLAVLTDSIEKTALSGTYDKYGQVIGREMAGDYLEILTEAGMNLANEKYNEQLDEDDIEPNKFQIGSAVSAYDHSEIFDCLLNEDASNYQLVEQQVDSIEYHDGHNFRSCVLGEEGSEYEIVTDEELIFELKNAILLRKYDGDRTGLKYFTAPGWNVWVSFWQGRFESYNLSRS
jgi:hypothetical protein